MFQQAIDAIRQGQRSRARDLLTRLLRADQNNPQYWLWMSSVVDSPKEQIYCLQTVIRLDPANKEARKGLIMLGALPVDGEVHPVPPIQRMWEVASLKLPKHSILRAVWSRPALRIPIITVISVLLFGMIFFGLYRLAVTLTPPVAIIPTPTPGPAPTFTHTPTAINFTPQAIIPTPSGLTPLVTLPVLVSQPTPLFVNTPHPAIEAYSIALRAFTRGDLEMALRYMFQASEVDPKAADIYYYIGEIYRAQGLYDQAVLANEKAIQVNPNFAPAYLGRARARHADKAWYNITHDVRLALQKDPNFGEAYLERAAYFLGESEFQLALDDLSIAEKLLGESALIHFYRAQALLSQDNGKTALASIRKALELDPGLLEGYMLYGEVSEQTGDYPTAIQAIKTYLAYQEKDAQAWLTLGRAYVLDAQPEAALPALEQALALDDELPEAYLYRGMAYNELGEGQPAVNDLMKARASEPRSFLVNLSLGRALMTTGRLEEARSVWKNSRPLAESKAELAAFHYYGALLLETAGDYKGALENWQALLDLDWEASPPDWLETASKRIAAEATAQANTLTSTLTSTLANTQANTPAFKLTITPSSTINAKGTPSPSPAKTVTIQPTLTPSP